MADKITAAASSANDDDQKVFVGPTAEDERRREKVVAEYDWSKEWYPLYLSKEVPTDAPLGLTVFDKHLVLYRDGHGELHCYQDRCPHRWQKKCYFFLNWRSENEQ